MSSQKTTLIASLFGNGIEWYDFILYANFAPIIATVFFPTKNTATSLLLTFAVFASGFLVRPLGAMIFGHIGDHLGRKTALITSMIMISIPTLIIGFVPGYNSIGLIAPILLTVLRLIQGIAISGELNSAATFLVEHAPDHRRGVSGSLVMGTAFLGILIGAVIATLVGASMSTNALNAWGWRIPFWFGGILGIIGLLLRLRIKESPKFLEQLAEDTHYPLKRVFLYFRKQLLLAIILVSIMAVGNVFLVAFVVTYLVKFQGFSIESANTINLIALSFAVLLFPVMGILSDRLGRKPVFKAGLLGMIFLSLPIFWLFSQKQFSYALAGDILLCLILVPIAALIPTLLAELFPTHVRTSGATLGYSICLALFGGTAPLMALTLIDVTGNTFAPAGYLIFYALLSYIALYFIEESYDKPLS